MSDRVNFVLPCSCGGNLAAVRDSRPGEWGGLNIIRRRRVCDTCGKRSTTVEAALSDMTAVQRAELVRLRASIDDFLKGVLAED